MARLKFLLFAIPVLALWCAQLYLLSPALTSRAIEMAALQARVGPAAVAARIDARRLELAKALGRATATPGIHTRETPSADRLAPVRAAAMKGLPDIMRRATLVGWINDNGGAFGRGDEDVKPSLEGVNLDALSKAGADGVALDVGGVAHWFYSAPLNGAGASEKPLGFLVIGAPLIGERLVPAVAQDTGVAALSLLKGGQKAGAAGPDQAVIDAALIRQAPANKTTLVAHEPVTDLFGIGLPMLTQSEARSEPAPQYVAARQTLEGTPYEVLALATLKPFLGSLASFQKVALLALAVLLAMTVLVVLLLGSSEQPRAMAITRPGGANAPPPVPMAGPAISRPSQAMAQSMAPAEPPPGQEPILSTGFQLVSPAQPSVAPEASPEDFPFGAPPPPTPAPESFPRPPPSAASQALSMDQQTRAYAVQTGSSAPPPAPMASQVVDFNPDQTRVQQIPDELIRATAQGAAIPKQARTWAEPPPPPAVSARSNSGDEDAHFQDVYRDFVSTRERCGEPADGLTFEKFVAKLRKNKEQLVQKYNCKTVRFQVYVKEGKAALKATPVRE